VQYAAPVPIPGNQGPVVAGMAAYVHYGCINCHGPNGLGGVPNPLSPDKAIPPLAGADFRGEFNTDAKIKEIIRSGSVIGRAPIVSMPHWGGILTEQELRELVALGRLGRRADDGYCPSIPLQPGHRRYREHLFSVAGRR